MHGAHDYPVLDASEAQIQWFEELFVSHANGGWGVYFCVQDILMFLVRDSDISCHWGIGATPAMASSSRRSVHCSKLSHNVLSKMA